LTYGLCACGDRSLIFTSNRMDQPSIWRIDLDGTNRKLLAGNAIRPACSPDAKWVVFTAMADSRLLKVPLQGGEARAATGEHEAGDIDDGEFSPDGDKLAYRWYGAERETELIVEPAMGGKALWILKPKTTAPFIGVFHWAPDSKALDLIKGESGDNIWRLPLDGSAPKQLTHFDSDSIWQFAWSPGGDKLALAKGPYLRDVVLIRNAAE
jgi:Tol biopolymer transport system component